MIARHWFGHVSPEGWNVRDWVARTGYTSNLAYVAENLGVGDFVERDMALTWANDPAHCANLMQPHKNRVGLAGHRRS